MLEQVGILGWENVEPILLAALAADQRPLLIGGHGCCKTEGAEIISRLLLGEGDSIIFRNYEVPILNPDDLFGYPNPKSLANGKIEFVDTPFAIWGAKAALFDELNRSNPLVQGKLHEIIRTKRLMGMATNLEFIFSAVNPPGEYDSAYMGLALASRFVCVQIPDAREMSRQQLRGILNGEGSEGLASRRRRDICQNFNKSYQVVISQEQKDDLVHILIRVVSKLNEIGVSYSMRQAKSALAMLEAAIRLSNVGLAEDMTNSLVMADIVLATVPEAHGVVANSVEVAAIRNVVFSLFKGFVLKDEVTMAKSLGDLLALEYEDKVSWAKAALEAIAATDDLDELQEGYEALKCSRTVGDYKAKIEKTITNKIFSSQPGYPLGRRNQFSQVGRV